ncbi:hypothetical protein, conserved [Plasmodium gonderi]|uniref:Uncharacterized protein n=1 Tax=Plasmodium gonderi TaxID=77519 RepID=A0A1Y1JJD5_PLAGO|nr:hypothetical protein, conserved [Plasmodium gonderi]GAW82616.1 hypothetical protein, conserved [Plasmodium gonderi]
MALKSTKKRTIAKKAPQKNATTKTKSKEQNFVYPKEEDLLNYNPFMTKEEIKPFELNIENEEISDEEEIEKDSFKELLKRRIKKMNQKVRKHHKRDSNLRKRHEVGIEISGKSWFENKLLNDVPRKLTIC